MSLGAAALIVPILSYERALQRQMDQVRDLCAELRPGTPYTKIRSAIEKHELWDPLLADQFTHGDSRQQQNAEWTIGVLAPMTLGDMECAITHNHVVVISTQVLGP